METILADRSISITSLKRNPGALIGATDGESTAVLVHNKPSARVAQAPVW